MKLYATLDAVGKTRTAKMASNDCLDIQIFHGNKKTLGIRVLEDYIVLIDPKTNEAKETIHISKLHSA